jgi:hypothetical protein
VFPKCKYTKFYYVSNSNVDVYKLKIIPIPGNEFSRIFFWCLSWKCCCCRPNEESCGVKTLEGSKLKCPAPISRLRVEKIEGGLMVAGVVVAANCQIILPIFGFLFLLVGCVLTGKKTYFPLLLILKILVFANV